MTHRTAVPSEQDRTYLDRAMQLAHDSDNYTHPNPRVGCVIASETEVIAEGVTASGVGASHAEAVALAQAGDRARGASAYVTLEPCCHQGRTGPCTTALINAGIKRVVVAMRDPDPRVSGGGIDALTDAGVEVVLVDMQARVRPINRGFFSRVERGRPWVRVKMAASADGRTATAGGESQWITSPESRADVQLLRSRADAILTGIGTVLADDPKLTVRGIEPPRHPLRVVVDSKLKTPTDAALFNDPGEILVVTTAAGPRALALEQAGAQVIVAPGGERVALDQLLKALAARQINEVHTECGPTLAGALVDAGLVDELVIYLAPKLIGSEGRGLFDLPGVASLGDASEFQISDIVRVGPDVRLTLLPKQAD